MTIDLLATLRQALSALEGYKQSKLHIDVCTPAITNLTAAIEWLEGQKQEPVAWRCWVDGAPRTKAYQQLCDDEPKAYSQREKLYTAPTIPQDVEKQVANDIAHKWLPNLKRREMESSKEKAAHNYVVDLCIKYVLNYVPKQKGEK